MSSPRAPKAFAEHAEPRIRLPRGFLAALATASVDVDRVTLEAGIAREQLASREPLVTGPQLARLYAELFQPPADPDLGLRLGASVRPELFGVVGLAALSAATYGAALERCARYKRMITDMRVEVTSTPELAVVRVDVPGPPSSVSHGRVDIELAFLTTFGRVWTERPLGLREVRLQRPAPGGDAHARFFGCPVRFGRPSNELVVERASLDTPLLGADAAAHEVLVDLAEHRLDEYREPLVARLGATIEGLLVDGPPRLSAVAHRMATSERTLQRALRREGTSFNALLDRTRRDLAFRLLRRDRVKIAEVAYLVGFSHVSSFYRAFERWAGTSPAAFVTSSSPSPRT